jgi:hypothetical protein
MHAQSKRAIAYVATAFAKSWKLLQDPSLPECLAPARYLSLSLSLSLSFFLSLSLSLFLSLSVVLRNVQVLSLSISLRFPLYLSKCIRGSS